MNSKDKSTPETIKYSIWETRTHEVNNNVLDQLSTLNQKEATTKK